MTSSVGISSVTGCLATRFSIVNFIFKGAKFKHWDGSANATFILYYYFQIEQADCYTIFS